MPRAMVSGGTARAVLRAVACLALLLALACARQQSPPAADRGVGSERQPTDCLSCHATLDPGLVSAWRPSAHAQRGVGCAGCHGVDHAAIFDVRGTVSAGVCATCHAQQYEEFSRSKHARAWEDMEGNGMFRAQSPDIRAATCIPCHQIGQPYADGSTGQCNYCHAGHAFSAEQARTGDACRTCHAGRNHPQQEAYDGSKHGILWRETRDTAIVPTCATCHLPDGLHDVGAGITLGASVHGAVLEGDRLPAIGMRVVTRAAFEENRSRMLAVCNQCHSSRFAREALEQADALKREADGLVAEARTIIEDLAAEDMLDLPLEDRPPNPVHGRVVVLGENQLFEDTTLIEQRFFELYNFHHAAAFKGAYHQAPDLAHWEGIARMKGVLSEIRSEARRLREEARVRGATGVGPKPDIEQYTGEIE